VKNQIQKTKRRKVSETNIPITHPPSRRERTPDLSPNTIQKNGTAEVSTRNRTRVRTYFGFLNGEDTRVNDFVSTPPTPIRFPEITGIRRFIQMNPSRSPGCIRSSSPTVSGNENSCQKEARPTTRHDIAITKHIFVNSVTMLKAPCRKLLVCCGL
jgi:hypothetical protein